MMQELDAEKAKTSKRKRKKNTARHESIEIRCTADEKDSLKEKAASLDLNLSEFVRRASLGMPVSAKSRQLDSLIYELNRIGTNLNQLIRLAHLDRLSSVDRDRLEDVFLAVETKLYEVCD